VGKKIVLIGAGSAVFTQGLVADLIQMPDLGVSELGLVDTSPEALDVVQRLVQRMITTKKADICLSASTDRRDILPGSDVVVTTIAVGGRRAWETDVFIPRQFGIYQPVGDSVMPGGISRALRMIPAMLSIARDIHALCPDARFFNYSNPMSAICRAVRKATNVKVIGLCHGTFHTGSYLAQLAGTPRSEATFLAVGLNHLTWIFDFRWKGGNALPMAYEHRGEGNPFSWSLYEAYGAFPAPGDRHTTEFFPERFPSGHYYGKILGVDAFSFEKTIEHGDRTYAEMRGQALGERPLKESIFQRAPGEHEQLMDMLMSIEKDERRVFHVNMPNQGAVSNLPNDAILELPAVATGRGFCQMHIDNFPYTIAALLNRKIAAQELTVEAALTGSRELLIEALLADGAVQDHNTARRLCDALLNAHKQYLPQFN